jgi:hypothetical protein
MIIIYIKSIVRMLQLLLHLKNWNISESSNKYFVGFVYVVPIETSAPI